MSYHAGFTWNRVSFPHSGLCGGAVLDGIVGLAGIKPQHLTDIMGGTGDGSARALPEWKKTSSSKRNFQLTLPVILFFKLRKHQPFILCKQATFLHTAQEHYFFHSESLLRHTLEEAGYNEKMKKEKKKNTRVAMRQHSMSSSQQGWPPRHHGKRSPEPAAAWPVQHSHKKEQHFLTEP